MTDFILYLSKDYCLVTLQEKNKQQQQKKLLCNFTVLPSYIPYGSMFSVTLVDLDTVSSFHFSYPLDGQIVL